MSASACCPLLALAPAALSWLLCWGCEPAEPAAPPLRPTGSQLRPASAARPASTPRPPPAPTAKPQRRAASAPDACRAPSVQHTSGIDGRDDSALESCVSLSTGEEARSRECGTGDPEPKLDLARLDAAVLPLDEATRQRISAIGRAGRQQGRNPRSFGMIGDSMTVAGTFMRPFSQGSGTTFELAPAIRQRLRTRVAGEDDRTIIDYYRGVEAERVQGLWRDSFGGLKAARVGARAGWAIRGDEQDQSALAIMVRSLSPAVAVIAYGGNDAAWRIAPTEQIAAEFEESFSQLLAAVERRGIIPLLSTIARHGDAPGYDACVTSRTAISDWRLAVQTNAINARIAAIACRRHLPLVDLRYALDGAVNHGLGPDGVHPSWYADGPGDLTARSLQCGYSIRNYLTLQMLRQIKEALEAAGVWSPPSAAR